MKLSKLGHAIGNGIDNTSRAMSWVSTAMVLMIFLLVTFDVVRRYFFDSPIKGSNDIGELLLVPIAFCAIGFTQLMKEHVRVTLIYTKFSPRGQAIVDAVMFFLGAAVWALIAWNMGERAWEMTMSTYVTTSTSPVLKIPHLPFVYLVTVGSLLLCLQLLADSVRALTERNKSGSS